MNDINNYLRHVIYAFFINVLIYCNSDNHFYENLQIDYNVIESSEENIGDLTYTSKIDIVI